MPPIYLQQDFLLCTEVNVVWRVQLSFKNDKGGILSVVSLGNYFASPYYKKRNVKGKTQTAVISIVFQLNAFHVELDVGERRNETIYWGSTCISTFL